jgi:hypothetical protein
MYGILLNTNERKSDRHNTSVLTAGMNITGLPDNADKPYFLNESMMKG